MTSFKIIRIKDENNDVDMEVVLNYDCKDIEEIIQEEDN